MFLWYFIRYFCADLFGILVIRLPAGAKTGARPPRPILEPAGLGWGDGEGDDGDGAGLGREEGVEGFGEGGTCGEDVVDEGDVAAGDGCAGVEGEGVAEVGGAAGGCLAGLGGVGASGA